MSETTLSLFGTSLQETKFDKIPVHRLISQLMTSDRLIQRSRFYSTVSLAAGVALVILFLPGISSLATQDKTRILVFAEGTPVKVVTTGEISSKTAKAGEGLTFKVDEDVSLDGHPVIAKGTPVNGSVINSEPAGRFGNSGKLGIAVQWTTTVTGQRINLRAAKGQEGDDKTVSTGFLTAVSPFFLLRKGGDASIPEGTVFTVYVAEPNWFRLEGLNLIASPPPEGSTIGAPSVTKDGWAVVFIYRPEKWLGYMQEPSVFVDDTELVRMDNGRYFAVKIPPGKHMIHMTNKKRSFVVDMGAGETYYFRVAIEQGLSKQHGKLTLEDAVTGRKEISKLKFIGDNKIKAPQLVVKLSPQ